MTDEQMLEVVRAALTETRLFGEYDLSIEGGDLVLRFRAHSPLAAHGMGDAAAAWVGNEMQFGPDFGPLFAPPFKPARSIDGDMATLRWALAPM